MTREEAERIVENAYPVEDNDWKFALAMFDLVGHYGLSALTDSAVKFMARSVLQSEGKPLEPLEPLPPPARIVPFPHRPSLPAPTGGDAA